MDEKERQERSGGRKRKIENKKYKVLSLTLKEDLKLNILIMTTHYNFL